jgi:hypothetical protein
MASRWRTTLADSSTTLGGWLLVLVVQRLIAVLLLRPGGYFYDFTDYYTYWQYARVYAEGFIPYRDFWMEYPPLFPLWNQTIYIFSLNFAPFPDFRFWHHFFLSLTLLPFDLGVVVLLHRIAGQMYDTVKAEWVVAVWVLAFVPLFVWQSFFDVLPLFGLLVAVWATIAYRPVWAGVGVAFGFLTKLLSVLALPAAVQVFAEGRGWRGWFSRKNWVMIGTFALICAVVLTPFFIIGPEWMLVMVQNFGGRGAWQTVWALLDGYYGYGIVLGDRFDPNPPFEVIPSRVPWWIVNLAFAVLGLWLWTRRWRWNDPRIAVGFTGIVVFLFYLWSKGWSPQFTLMLIPWCLLLFPNLRGILFTLLFTMFMVGDNLFYNYWVYQSDDITPLFVLVIARTLTLVAFTILAYRQLRFWNEESQPELAPIPIVPLRPTTGNP